MDANKVPPSAVAPKSVTVPLSSVSISLVLPADSSREPFTIAGDELVTLLRVCAAAPSINALYVDRGSLPDLITGAANINSALSTGESTYQTEEAAWALSTLLEHLARSAAINEADTFTATVEVPR